MTDRELTLPSDDKLRAEFEKLKDANSAALEASEEEMEQIRLALLQDLEAASPLTIDEF